MQEADSVDHGGFTFGRLSVLPFLSQNGPTSTIWGRNTNEALRKRGQVSVEARERN